jgi:uncharacterized damage-inducible protein DinB
MTTNPGRPQPDEHAPYFSRYIDLVPEEDLVDALEAQTRETAAVLAAIDEKKSAHRYAPEKWSIKQVVGHITDGERMFAYRLLAIARGEQQSLPSFDENEYMRAANFDERPFADLREELAAVRRSTLLMARGMSAEGWARIGVANENRTSARALGYMILGHERHHLRVLRERYLV